MKRSNPAVRLPMIERWKSLLIVRLLTASLVLSLADGTIAQEDALQAAGPAPSASAADGKPDRVTPVPHGPPGAELSNELLGAYAQASAGAAKKLALVIGNSNYLKMPPLRNPANDAKALAAKLRSLNFTVQLVIDGDRSAIVEAAPRLARVASSADLVAFFYAGHGAQVRGVNYLYGVDSRFAELAIAGRDRDAMEFELERDGVSASQILSLLEQSAPIRVFVLDACRDDPLGDIERQRRTTNAPSTTRSSPVAGNPARQTAGFAAMRGRSGTYIAYSTEPGKIALDESVNSKDHSPFSKAILSHVSKPGLTIEQIFNEVRRDVLVETEGKQLPWSESALLGSLYLQPPPPAAIASLPELARQASTHDGTVRVADPKLASKLEGKQFTLTGETTANARMVDGALVVDGDSSSTASVTSP